MFRVLGSMPESRSILNLLELHVRPHTFQWSVLVSARRGSQLLKGLKERPIKGPLGLYRGL